MVTGEAAFRLRRWLQSGAVAAGLLVAAVVVGWLSTLDNPLFVAAPLVLLIAAFIATRPIWLFWAVVVGGLVASGLTRLYLPQLQEVRWLLAPTAWVLAFYALFNRERPSRLEGRSRVPTLIYWALAFMAISAVSSAVAGFSAERYVVGFKGYFQVWGLLFSMAFGAWAASTIDRVPKALFAIAWLQLPFVAHQLLFLVPRREGMGDGIVAIDIVSGTFGATLDGGGSNATLSAFLMMVLGGLIAAWQAQLISRWRLFLVGGIMFAPVLLNEAKVSIIYLAAVFLTLFSQDIKHRPARFLGGAMVLSALMAVMMAAYTLNSPDAAGLRTWGDLIRYTYEYNVESKETAGQLSRAGAWRFWAEHHENSDLWALAFGHGVGYTRVGDGDSPKSETVKSFNDGIPVFIDLGSAIGNTTVATLLWETGLIGLFAVFGLLAATFKTARELAKVYSDNPQRAASLRAAQAAMAILFVTLWHKNLFVFDVVYQTLMVLLIGYVAYWQVQNRPTTDEREAPDLNNSRPDAGWRSNRFIG